MFSWCEVLLVVFFFFFGCCSSQHRYTRKKKDYDEVEVAICVLNTPVCCGDDSSFRAAGLI
jgi:hypothetical protein